ncbi:hypothetical protein Q4E40_02590 [Pontibacter sp. BT731]|uniref:hypothetical protein n=1 Tax=Pontibacter coccineus TaxID=3063328 RepID=UPI0026E11A10|nr:hypothetical protein [Pontibacter sp. BT731]MDO6389000.1 hypothetical protein [Pontibacter sp. BT731]
MIKQHPHTLQYIAEGTPAYQDGEGYWEPGEPGSLEVIKCRAEANSKGELVKTADGAQVSFRFTVYLPKGTASIPYGTEVKIFAGGELLAEEQVKNFHPGQLNCRLWV